MRISHKQTTRYIYYALVLIYYVNHNEQTRTNKLKRMFDHKMVIDVIHFMEKRMFVRALA